MYSANQVAHYIVNHCSKAGKPISNLKLQKLLYFVWIDYYKAFQTALFYNDIHAWQFGPVVPEVYSEYCSYGGRDIYENYPDEHISQLDAHCISGTINKYIDTPVSRLVNMTHESGTAWHEIYCAKNSRSIIPFSLIIQRDCR